MSPVQKRWLSLASGPFLYLIITLTTGAKLSTDEVRIIAIAGWMLAWWVTEVVPIAVTALLPLVLFPMSGLMNVGDTATSYGSKYVFLFMGGFLIALAMEKWNLLRRIALRIVVAMGTSGRRIVLGFMIATAFLSMWISNTATTLMMLPIALSVIGLLKERVQDKVMGNRFALVLLLSIAYAANCGGIATLVGTPPNVAMAGIISENYSIDIGFGHWMLVGVPFSMTMLFVVYWLLTRVLHPIRIPEFEGGTSLVKEELQKLGPLTESERRVMWVFVITAVLWIFKDFSNQLQSVIVLNDPTIAMISGISLFLIANGEKQEKGVLLDWKDTEKLPWGILLLFGGGLALANGFKSSGLVDTIAAVFAQQEVLGVLGLMIALTLVSLFLTELMSNLALVLVFVPVVGAIAEGMGLDPLRFAVPVTLAASCAFMLPMATPPNAIVFASGEISIAKMARTGFLLNIIAALLATALCWFILDPWLARL